MQVGDPELGAGTPGMAHPRSASGVPRAAPVDPYDLDGFFHGATSASEQERRSVRQARGCRDRVCDGTFQLVDAREVGSDLAEILIDAGVCV